MTKKLTGLIEMYGIELASLSAHAATWQNMEKIDHTRGMIDTMLVMEDPDKLNRWLGFVQGVLWMLDARTVDQLRTETRECAAGKE